MIDTDNVKGKYCSKQELIFYLNAVEEVKRFKKMCLDEMVCYDCLSDLYKAGLSDENPVDAYWCGMCSEPMKGLVE